MAVWSLAQNKCKNIPPLAVSNATPTFATPHPQRCFLAAKTIQTGKKEPNYLCTSQYTGKLNLEMFLAQKIQITFCCPP